MDCSLGDFPAQVRCQDSFAARSHLHEYTRTSYHTKPIMRDKLDRSRQPGCMEPHQSLHSVYMHLDSGVPVVADTGDSSQR